MGRRPITKVLAIVISFMIACIALSAWVQDRVHEVYVEHLEERRR